MQLNISSLCSAAYPLNTILSFLELVKIDQAEDEKDAEESY